MFEFKYQMHCHTFPCSHCGKLSPSELVDSLCAGGYDGACITNHFFNGNSGIDRSLPWKDFVGAYEADWLECKKYAEEAGINIFFGIEEGVGCGREILCYGLTAEMLYSHPELREKNAELWYKTLSPLGVLIIQAHPFREKDYITEVGVLPAEFIDGIEVFNAGNEPTENLKAEEFAARNGGLILTSGADAHTAKRVPFAGIAAKSRIESSQQLVEVLKSGDYICIKE